MSVTAATADRASVVPWRTAWPGRIAAVLVLAGAAAAWWYRDRLPALAQVLLWAVLLAAAAVLSRRGWLRLFGPVLFYDLLRQSRRGRFFLLRGLYSVALLALLYWTHNNFVSAIRPVPVMVMTPSGPVRTVMYGGINPAALGAQQMSELAEQFFHMLMVIQFSAVLLLAPAYAAGAVCEEKDRKTLEFLLATDLANREIVLSKLMSRFANLALFVFTGLPVLGLLQFLGGVDPNLVLAGYAATGLTMASLTCFCVLCSVYVKKPRDAILLSYLGVGGYLTLASLAEYAFGSNVLTDAINSGNVLAALSRLKAVVDAGSDLAAVVPGMLRDFALFHGLLALVCAVFAVLHVRVVALRQSGGTVQRQRTPGRFGRPRMGRLPMIWKEMYIEPGFRLNWLGHSVLFAVVALSVLPGLYILGSHGDELLFGKTPTYNYSVTYGFYGITTRSLSSLAGAMNTYARLTSAAILCLMLVGVAVRASTSVSGERDRETLDGLLTSPLESHDILFSKWLGSLLSVRWAWLWLGLVWAFGFAAGGLHPLVVPMQMSAWLVYAACLSGLGLWFSTSSRTSLRATLNTLTVIGVVGASNWLLLFFCCPTGSQLHMGLEATVTPPAILYALAITPMDIQSGQWDIEFVFAMFGLMLWALAAAFLWSVTRSRFRRLTSRMPRHVPAYYEMATSEYARRIGQKL